VSTSGAAYCWGDNGYGQFGNGSWVSTRSPVAAASGRTFASLTAGNDHTCGVTSSGAAYCWGWNEYGQVGASSIDTQYCVFGAYCSTPLAVAGGLAFASLTAGGNHSCALTSGGAAYCWGQNQYGQLGDGSTSHRSTPVAVANP
jgi:alpha-tubulin suppressor-like RCC1 family protein